MAAALLGAFLAAPAAASAALLTFDNYPTGTEITNQYEAEGVLFSGDYETPEIASDRSTLSSPVLRGGGDFYQPIHATFVIPNTTTPGTVNGLSVDVGFIDDLYSTEIVIHSTSGDETVYAEDYGTNTITSNRPGITGFEVLANEEGAGFGIDNLAFTPPPIPPPPPPPPPTPTAAPPPAPTCAKYLVIDSRGSGEPNGQLSEPGQSFLSAFKSRLKALKSNAKVGVNYNSYPAVSVFSWIDPGPVLNGLGALMHSGAIGAYKDSENEGVKVLKALVTQQVSSACSATKMILLGYSQGAQVTGDVFEKLPPAVRKHVAAVVLWGDPHYDHEDDAVDQNKRQLDGALGARAIFPSGPTDVISYCLEHDPVCQWRLPAGTLAKYKLREHHEYWGSSSAPAESAGHQLAIALSK